MSAVIVVPDARPSDTRKRIRARVAPLLSAEERSERARLRAAARTPEQWAEIKRKISEGVKAAITPLDRERRARRGTEMMVSERAREYAKRRWGKK